MSHMHLPDGVLPLWLCLLGYLAVILYLCFYFNYIKKTNSSKKIVLAAIMSAFMIITMSVEFFSYHFNLSALSGILLGPVFAPMAILTVNILLSIFKHGGISTIGLNTFIVSAEAISAYYLFRYLKPLFKSNLPRVFISTFLALLISTSISILIIYTGTKNLAEFADHDHEHCEQVSCPADKHEKTNSFDIKKFLLLIFITGGIGWTIESLFTAFVFDYLNKVKPEVISSLEADPNEDS